MVDYSYFIVICIIAITLYVFFSTKKKNTIVIDIICYPIKSCAGIHLAKADIETFGIKDDRKWSIFYENKPISQTDEQRLLRLQPSFKYTLAGIQSNLIMIFPGFLEFSLPLSDNNDFSKDFILWGADGKYVDEGDEVAKWLFNVFGKNYRLGRIIEPRIIGKTDNYAGKSFENQQISFASEGQILIVNQESLDYLKESLPGYVRKKINFDCFRPNIIVKNLSPYDEDSWNKFTINGITFEGFKKCDRCRMTTIDQDTIEFDSNCEPLNTLRKVHGNGAKGYFGLLAVRLSNGSIRLGDLVTVLSKINR